MSIFVKENHKNKNVAYPEVWITNMQSPNRGECPLFNEWLTRLEQL